ERVIFSDLLNPLRGGFPVHGNQFVADLKRRCARNGGIDEIDEGLAFIEVYFEQQVGLEIRRKEELRMRVIEVGNVCCTNLVKFDVVVGGADFGQPRGKLQQVDAKRIPLPFVGRILFGEKGGELLEIDQLLFGQQLGGCCAGKAQQGGGHAEFHKGSSCLG